MPPNAAVAGYYYQAINKDAPHPAAARLWQEFLYCDEGQNLLPRAVPGRCAPTTMMNARDHRQGGRRASCPVIDGPVTVPSRDQTKKATKYLTDNWAKAIG